MTVFKKYSKKCNSHSYFQVHFEKTSTFFSLSYQELLLIRLALYYYLSIIGIAHGLVAALI